MDSNFFFPTYTDISAVELSILLLIVRLVIGSMMLSHGIEKIKSYKYLSENFPDPLKIGNKMSVNLAIFGEVVCTLGFISGLLFKFALIAMIVNMLVALKVDSMSKKFSIMEPALLYLFIFVIMFIAGPGLFAIDYFI